jgi:hypothetical protein
MKLDDLRGIIRRYQPAIAMLAVTSSASADTAVPCNTGNTTHPQISSCGNNSCTQPASASCWGPPGADWADGVTYAGGKIEVINGLRYVRAYAFGSLEDLANGNDYYAYVWSTTTAGGSVQCNDGTTYVRDFDADGQWVNNRCNVSTTIRVLAYIDDD